MLRPGLWVGGAALMVAAGLPACADEKADSLLKEVARANQAAKSLAGNISFAQKSATSDVKTRGTFRLQKPNFARIVLTGKEINQTIVSDGKTVWMLFGNQYQKMPADRQGQNISALWAAQIPMFFQPGNTGLFKMEGTQTRHLGSETVGGKEFEVVEVKGKQQFEFTAKFYIGKDRFIHRAVVDLNSGGQTYTLTSLVSDLKVGATVPTTAFAYKPPKNVRAFEQPNYEAKLVKVGAQAPEFNVPTPDGKRVSLGELTKGSKAVLVNFWFYG